jgi:hypothetical protein
MRTRRLSGGSLAIRAATLAASLGLASLTGGCASLKLQMVDSATRKPSNVAMYFTVDRNNGDPVPGLEAKQFTIYEDGKPISEHESKQTILNKEVAAAHFTLLLVDMSGSVVASGQVPALQDAAAAFTERVEKFQKVGIYAFDGSTQLYPISPLSSSAGSAKGGVANLGRLKPKDDSTNLHGAVVEGIKTLQKALDGATQPLKFGTLVIFTDGTDRAARVSREDMMKAVDEAKFDIFVVGVGAEIDARELRSLGKSGTVLETKREEVKKAFDQIASRIEGYTKRYYLLSYCSPARAGEHDIRVEVKTADGASGSLEAHKFDAKGFGPNCDPNRAPPFDTSLRNKKGQQAGQPGA